jgi:hypothetical protein
MGININQPTLHVFQPKDIGSSLTTQNVVALVFNIDARKATRVCGTFYASFFLLD